MAPPQTVTLNAPVRVDGIRNLPWWLPKRALPASADLPRGDHLALGGAACALALVLIGHALTGVPRYSWRVLAGVVATCAYALPDRMLCVMRAAISAWIPTVRPTAIAIPGVGARQRHAAQVGAGTTLIPSPPFLPLTVAGAHAAGLVTRLLGVTSPQVPPFGMHLADAVARSGGMVSVSVASTLGMGWALLTALLARLVGGRSAGRGSPEARALATTAAGAQPSPVLFHRHRLDPEACVAGDVPNTRTAPGAQGLAVASRDRFDHALGQGLFPPRNRSCAMPRRAVAGRAIPTPATAPRSWAGPASVSSAPTPPGPPASPARRRPRGRLSQGSRGLRTGMRAGQAQGAPVQVCANRPHPRADRLRRLRSGPTNRTRGGG